jgi:hypothetical protein
MRKVAIVTIACFAGLSVTLGGCAQWQLPWQKKSPPPAPVVATPVPPPAPTSLTTEAESILIAAAQRVRNAEITRTLWSSAKTKLEEAREAAKKFDSPTTIRLATEVIALCERSEAQAKSAPVTW